MSWFWFAGYLFTSEYAPVQKWYQEIGLIVLWPAHLGKYFKEKNSV